MSTDGAGRQRTPLRVAFRRPWPTTLRGLILWHFGLAFIAIGGVQYLGTAVPEPTRTYLTFALHHFPFLVQGLPPQVYGGVFVAVGAFACVTAYCHFNRDQHGYSVAATWAAVWGLVYVAGWLVYDAPVRAVGAAVPWFLFSAVLSLCAKIPKIVLHLSDDER